MEKRKTTRRTFLGASTAITLGAVACGNRSIKHAVDATTSIDGAPPDGSTNCTTKTEDNIEGPFFKVDSPLRTDLVTEGVAGDPIKISGRVLDTSCRPVANALLDFWQANDQGDYDNDTFVLRGHQYTDAEGFYQLTTVAPGRYLNGNTFRPSHIHVKVGKTGFSLLTTQLYFENDPFNETDPWIRDSLILTLSPSRNAHFDFVIS